MKKLSYAIPGDLHAKLLHEQCQELVSDHDFVTLLPSAFGAGRASVLLDKDLPALVVLVPYS